MKKFLAILLALTVVLSLCACGGNGDQGGSKGGKDADGNITLTIGIPTSAKVTSLEDNALTKWLEAETGYNIEFVEYSGGTDVTTQISTTVAARKELPDILFCVKMAEDVVSTYGRDGYFVDLAPYYEDKEGASKTFWTRLEEELTEEEQEYVLRTITDADTGKIFLVPTIETSLFDKRTFQPWINQVWLDNLGLKMPTNAQELYDVLVAFKNNDANGNGDPNDEIPLFGTEKGHGAHVIEWLLNMFVYYDSSSKWQPDENGQLQLTHAKDEYREGLKFVNKLYKEELLTNMVYTATGTEMQGIVTPASGVAMCGVFVGHLTSCTNKSQYKMLDEYVPMPMWGYVTEQMLTCSRNTFITDDCDHPDEAFNLLMTMFSWEGSMRMRYGEYGVHWEDADEGVKSLVGLDARYKLISDAYSQQGNALWGQMASCFNAYAEGETAQISDQTDPATRKRAEMHTESRRIFEEAVANNNPEVVCPLLVHTNEEKDATLQMRTNVNTYISKMETAFVTGIGANVNSDAEWAKYLQELEKLGMSDYQKYEQTAYDRQ